MSASTKPKATPNLNIYCQSHSLLFQFLLKEFIATFKEVQDIEQNVQRMENILRNRSPLLTSLDTLRQELFFKINKLTGAQLVNEPHFPWSTQKGCLNKLHHYCYLFAHIYPQRKKETSEINTCIRKAFHSAMESREVLLCLQQDIFNEKAMIQESKSLPPLFDKLIDNISKVSHLLLPLMASYRDNENVLFFILNRQEELDNLYHASCLAHLMQQMYPGGAKEAKEFLIHRYTQRGFHHLLAAINQKMNALGG